MEGAVMALMQCPDCKREVSSEAKLCPHCHCNVAGAWKRKVPKAWSVVIWVSGVLAGLSFFLLSFVLLVGRIGVPHGLSLRRLFFIFATSFFISAACQTAAYYKYR